VSLVTVLALTGSAGANPSRQVGTPAPDVPALIKAGESPQEAACRLLAEAIRRWAGVRTMEATFTRCELLQDKTERGDKEVIFMRERTAPRGIYMKWLEGPGQGRELAFVPGRDDKRFIVTPGGALRWVVVERELNHAEVFAVSRHTPAEAGLGHLLGQLDEQFRLSKKDAVVVYAGEASVGDRPCYRFMRFLPEKAGPDGTKYYCWKLDLCIDKELCLPVSVKCYGWKRQFDWQKEPFEEYVYTNLIFNRSLGEDAFDVRKSEE